MIALAAIGVLLELYLAWRFLAKRLSRNRT
jgi:hypothetical protein